MFKNTGKKIQKVSGIVFSVQAVVSCIAGVVLWAVLPGREVDIREFMLAFLIGAVVAAIGVRIAWLGQLLLQGFGKIAEYCEAELDKNETK